MILSLLVSSVAIGTLPVAPPQVDWTKVGSAPFATGIPELNVSGVPQFAESRIENGTLWVKVRERNINGYSVEVKTRRNQVAIKKGDVIYVRAKISCPQSRHESGEGILNSYLQLSGPPWDSQGMINGSVSRAVRTFHFAAKAVRDYEPGTGEFTFHIGSQAQTLVFHELVIRNVGPDVDPVTLPKTLLTYPGIEANAPWRKKAAANIERYRKTDLEVTVRDRRGRPIKGAKVRVRQLRHAYEFGSFIEDTLLQSGPDADRYRATFLKYFNKATVPMYWADWGWVNNEANYLKNAEWMQRNRIPTKAHVLLYPGKAFMPEKAWALMDRPAELRSAIDNHIRDIFAKTKRFGFVSWDIINETRDLQELPRVLGDTFYSDVYKLAHSLDSKPVFYINDYAIVENAGNTQSNQDFYLAMIQKLLKQGAPVEGIGIQGHFGESLTSPEIVWSILDRFAKFKLPIQTTEFDIVTRDEAGQAAYTRDYYTAFFAHPSTTGITQWGFWEKSMWQPVGAMFRTDWTPKPNALAFYDLVYRQWWTDQTKATGQPGKAMVRAFKGEYEVTVAVGKRVVRKRVSVTSPTELGVTVR